jgi:hypothetical protein
MSNSVFLPWLISVMSESLVSLSFPFSIVNFKVRYIEQNVVSVFGSVWFDYCV